MSAISSAIAGLNAAQMKFGVSANNTANSGSAYAEEDGVPVNKPYQPQQVQNQTMSTGEVRAVVLPQSPATVPVYEPASLIADANGMVKYPNVSEDDEVANRIIAKNAYKASLKVLEADKEMSQSLLDII